MKEIQFKYTPYTLKLKKEFFTSKGGIKERNGFIFMLNSKSGAAGIGDCAPFPEFGSETYEDAFNLLSNINLNLKIDLDDITTSINENLSPYDSFPAVRHGLEQAILYLIAKEKQTTINSLLNLSPIEEILVNAAIGLTNVSEAVTLADIFIRKGYQTLKLKLGRADFTDDYNIVKAVRAAVGETINIRIDINGLWNFDEAVKNLNSLSDFNIEYAEQPVNTLMEYSKLADETDIPIAPDESIRDFETARQFIEDGKISVLILKPMMLGGLLPLLNIAEEAAMKNIDTVVTSSFESAVGRSYAVLAAGLCSQKYAHGLGVAEYFLNDVITDPYPVNNGKIILAS